MPKIGILKEGKVPIDRRVAIIPSQAKYIKENFPGVDLVCQKSDIRCFPDEDYTSEGIELVNDVQDCDIIFGVKEVPLGQLIPDKTYFFFSHTIKKQDYNRELLNEALDKNIRLIDYETLTDANNQRIIAFGRYAGIVGAYNGIWSYGKRYNLFNIRRAHECFDLEDMKTEYDKIKLPKIKIVITGGGRVGKGAMEVLLGLGIRKVTPERFVSEDFNEPVFTQLNSRDYNKHKEGKEFSRSEFFESPGNFESDFYQYAKCADLLIACAYWHPEAPVLFTREDATHRDFKINIIADVTCDIEGSIPSTIRPAVIDDPVFDYDPTTGKEMPAFAEEGNITVMSVDNLPCELPRNASEDFGHELVNNVLPCLFGDDPDKIVERATIAENGKLTSHYSYLQDYANGKA
ncbi:MAG: NAD(P)-dependent oxidoreductase [Reichenbachiella sp.]|uniref:NAD(P)-dependent oxidoreductase n=1 Tax=Reichenbachiella sp. TaxID=2184521 RepID=UPI0032650758